MTKKTLQIEFRIIDDDPAVPDLVSRELSVLEGTIDHARMNRMVGRAYLNLRAKLPRVPADEGGSDIRSNSTGHRIL